MKKTLGMMILTFLILNYGINAHAEEITSSFDSGSIYSDFFVIDEKENMNESEKLLQCNEEKYSTDNIIWGTDAILFKDNEDENQLVIDEEENLFVSDTILISNNEEIVFTDETLDSRDIEEELTFEKAADIIAPPTDLRIYQTSQNSVMLYWNDSENVEYYELYRDINNAGDWKKVKNIFDVYGSNLNLINNNIYSYKVRGVASNNGQRIYSLFSDVVSIEIRDYKVENVGVLQKNLNSIYLTWTEVPGATKYALYRKENEDGWSWVKTAHLAFTTNLNLDSSSTYSYKIVAFIDSPTGIFMGSFSEPVTITLNGSAPENLTVSKSSPSTVRLTWNKVDGCDHYELFRDIDNSGIWNKVKNVYGEIGSNLNLEDGNEYSYKVRAVFENEMYTYAGEFSEPVTILFETEIPTIDSPVLVSTQQIGTNRVQIEWNRVNNADYYVLYRSDDGGNWVKVKTTTENTVQNLALREKIVYQYRITAVIENSSGTYESQPSNEMTFTLGQDFIDILDLSATYLSDSRVRLTWSDMDNDITGYTLYRKIYGGEWTKIKNVLSLQTNNLNLEEGKIYLYYIKPYKTSDLGIYYGHQSNTALYWNQIVDGTSISNETITWDEVENADGYFIYADDSKIATVDNLSEYNIPQEYIGCWIRVSAYCVLDEGIVESRLSEAILFAQNSNTVFRALLIGETAYSTRLNGPDNDISYMNSMLSGLEKPYDVISQQNATRDEIVDLIDIAFDGATDEDVSLFFYSGHGVTGAGEYYSGALQTVDYQYLTTGDLAEILSSVPGRVIVILDSCGSGAAISDGTENTFSIQSINGLQLQSVEETDLEVMEQLSFDAEQFNSGVINAFKSYDSTISGNSNGDSLRAGELKLTKFFVLTGSGYEENSLTTMINGIWGGVLTRGIASGTGCSYPDGLYSGVMPADSNCDNSISFSELSSYCKTYAGDRQNVLSYSAAPNYLIFIR